MNGVNSNLKSISLQEFAGFLFDHIVPLEDLVDLNNNPLANSFPYWRKNDLLPFIPKGRWIELSFIELLWIRILDTLRLFSYKVEDTQKVSSYFFEDAYYNDLPEKILRKKKDNLLKKKSLNTILKEEEEVLIRLESMLSDEKLLYILKFDINYLSLLITNCISSGEDAGILIFPGGEVMEHIGDLYYSHRKNKIDRSSPHIYISIRHLLGEFVDNDELEKIFMSQVLNDDEKIVLKELRNRNIQEILIKKNGIDILKIESSTGGTITGDQAKQIRKILGLRNYEEIHINSRDEKTLTFKRTRKKINSD